nr:SDR family oxidoreductase [Angustibacter aerolatus]
MNTCSHLGVRGAGVRHPLRGASVAAWTSGCRDARHWSAAAPRASAARRRGACWPRACRWSSPTATPTGCGPRPTSLGATAVVADLTDPADVDRLAAEVREVLGGAPDVLVNAAGITGATGAFHEIDDAGWLETLQADLLSSVRLTRAFVEEMAHRGSGRIVNVASEDALNAYTDDPPYVASKAALLALTKVLSKTYGHRGVLVNAVSPAFIETPMTDAMMDERAQQDGGDRDDAVARFLHDERPGIEPRRRGTVGEVAAVIVFVVSERATFVNGSSLPRRRRLRRHDLGWLDVALPDRPSGRTSRRTRCRTTPSWPMVAAGR